MSTLLVASTGGHLAQLAQFAPRLRGEGDMGQRIWVTFDTPQSRSLLAGQEVVFVRHTHSRDYLSVARNTMLAPRLLRERGVGAVVSTGSGIALSFLPPARALGIASHYIESAARSTGPSLTGRIMARVPGVNLYAQYPSWAHGRWRYAGSVFDGFRATRPARSAAGPSRIVVALGAIGGFGFRRLLERLTRILPSDAEVLWQTGATDVAGLRLEARPSLPAHELHEAMRRADVVVAHAGIGSALDALAAGRYPLLVPRQKRYGEHVDDHQEQIAAELAQRGLALACSVEDLDYEKLLTASGRGVESDEPPPFDLYGTESPPAGGCGHRPSGQ